MATYSISTPATNGGKPCSNANGENTTQVCNLNACPVDCIGSFSEYGECSLPCGKGLGYQIFKPHSIIIKNYE